MKKYLLHCNIRVGATILSWSPYVKYLGLQFDQPLNSYKQVEIAKIKFLAASNSSLGLRAKVHLYSTMLRPLLVTWITAADSHLKSPMILNLGDYFIEIAGSARRRLAIFYPIVKRLAKLDLNSLGSSLSDQPT